MKLKDQIKKLDESLDEYLEEAPKSEKLFVDIKQLQREIRDKDKIIESLKKESTELTNQVSMVVEEKSTILEKLEKSRWFESKVAVATKKVYEDKVKSVINENVDSKLIPVLTAVARRKQGNQQLNWGNWLKIPENRYLFQVNEDIAKKIFEDTNALIPRKRTRGGGKELAKFSKYSLTFTGNTAATAQSEYVSTDFNPDTYNLNLGFTVSYWVRADEVGATQFAFGRKHSNSERFTFGINKTSQIYVGTGGNKLTGAWNSGLADNSSGQTAAELFPSLFDDGDLKTGNWLHFVVTYADRSDTSSSVARIVYLNGKLIRTQNVNWSSTGGSTGGIYFGARNLTGNYNYGWACGLDQVAIFNTAKDADWVARVYNTDRKSLDLSNESGLVGYWKFAKGEGITVKDYSGNGNHGTFAAISGGTTAYPTWEKS